jgi:hypothetical protein
MKKSLITIILFLAVSSSYAQSLSFEDLLNLTSMSGAQAHDLLTISKDFKSSGQQTVDGKIEDQYKIMKTPDKTETVLLGEIIKNTAGGLSREVTYLTVQESDINSLLAQAKKTTLSLIFQGSDVNKNIYRFDNSLFRATISLSFDKKWGSVEIAQK